MQLDFSLLVPTVKSPAKKNLLFDFSVFNATLFWDNTVSLCTWEKDSVSWCLNELRTKILLPDAEISDHIWQLLATAYLKLPETETGFFFHPFSCGCFSFSKIRQNFPVRPHSPLKVKTTRKCRSITLRIYLPILRNAYVTLSIPQFQ